MSLSPILIAVFVPVILAMLAFAWLRAGSAGWRERQLMTLAQRRNLAVPDHLEAELLRHVTRRQRAWVVGFGVAFLVVYVPASLLLPESGSRFGFVPIVLAFTAGATVTTIATLVDRRRAVFGDARVGRVGGPAIDDLVPVSAVRIVAVAVFVAVFIAAVVSLLLPKDDPSTAAAVWQPLIIILAALGVVTLALWRVASARIAASRPISGDATTLAWSDALRAESISTLLMLPIVNAMMSIQFAVPAIVTAFAPDQFEAFNVGMLIGLAVSLTVILVVHATTSGGPGARHYQRRLWPELAAATSSAAPAPAEGRA